MSKQNTLAQKRIRSHVRAIRKAIAASKIPFAGVVYPKLSGPRRNPDKEVKVLTASERFDRLKAMFSLAPDRMSVA